jgi:hypothetical protein
MSLEDMTRVCLTAATAKASERDHIIRPGVIIRERHKQAQERRITRVIAGQYVVTTGIASGRETRISWKTLGRYDVVR